MSDYLKDLLKNKQEKPVEEKQADNSDFLLIEPVAIIQILYRECLRVLDSLPEDLVKYNAKKLKKANNPNLMPLNRARALYDVYCDMVEYHITSKKILEERLTNIEKAYLEQVNKNK